MRIEIRKRGIETAILISFDTNTEKFESNYDRNKFFSGLYGRKQIVIKQEKRYVYHRNGMLDQIPHKRVGDSVFLIMREHLRMMERFFREWEDKVEFKAFPVLLPKKEIRMMQKEADEE